jgi:hypothetical protein
MPGDLDYGLLSFIQLKKSKYHLPTDVNITIETVLNLSSHMFDWEKSKLPKEFFIEKYNAISNLLIDYKHNKRIYDGDELYGHLDLQRECISEEIDYYIGICPDMYFSEHLLAYLIEGAKQIPNKYFVLTPQISKMWDATWDEITNPLFNNIPYNEWSNVDVFDVRYTTKDFNGEIKLAKTNNSKFAGWFDLMNKAFYEEMCPVWDIKGYGPWDWYSMITSDYCKEKGVDFQQYLLKGQTIFEYSVGPLKDGGFSKYYKDMLVMKDIPNQREQFESRMGEYLDNNIKRLKEKGILK